MCVNEAYHAQVKFSELYLFFVLQILVQRFENECRKTKTEVITAVIHNRVKEPIKTPWLTQSAGKHVRETHDWICFTSDWIMIEVTRRTRKPIA